MQVHRIEIDNFKSLVEFDLDLGHFTCLIGLNGSGKSTVLQAVDFLAGLFRGYVSEWLAKRQWKAADLSSSDDIPESILPFKIFMCHTTSLDLLAPQYLRQRTRQSGGGLGLGGERLSAFIHELSDDRLKALEQQLRLCYPQLTRIHTSSLRSGWKQLEVRETFGDQKISSEARHINDGMLRLIAILAKAMSDDQFLLFDEIENGINPELVEFLLDVLVNARQQILVTTHSPMILNYLDDNVARAGVQYLYKSPEGFTRSIPFFEIPSLAEKLKVMGPGEAFVDTDMTGLYDEIQTMAVRDMEKDDADSR